MLMQMVIIVTKSHIRQWFVTSYSVFAPPIALLTVLADYCYCLEDTHQSDICRAHAHYALQFKTDVTFSQLRDFFGDGDIQPIRDWQRALEYCKKNGNYKHLHERLPVQYSEPNPEWYDWQRKIIYDPQNNRQIHIVIDPHGGSGKTYVTGWLCSRHKAVYIDVGEKYEDAMRQAYKHPAKWYIIDIPRASPKIKLAQLFAAIERIKDGFIRDGRYTEQRMIIDSPRVTVFINYVPDPNWLSDDRWLYIDIPDKRLSLSPLKTKTCSYDSQFESNLYTTQYDTDDSQCTI